MPRRGALLFPLLVLFAGASLIREAAVGFLAGIEEMWAASLMRRAPPAGIAPLTLVEITDETLVKHLWPPMKAEDFAVFFHAALPFDPAVVCIEPVLDATRGALAGEDREPVHEQMLHDGILRTSKLILGGQLAWQPDNDSVQDVQPMPLLRNVTGDLARVPEFTAVEAWAAEQFRLSTRPGWMNLDCPPGRCPLVLRYRGQPVPGIVLQLAIEWAKVPINEVAIVLGSHVQLGPHRIPVDAAGTMALHPGAGFERTTYDELQLVREQLDKKETPARPAEIFRDRVLLLGRTDGFVRSIATPGGAKASPAEIFSAALATIQLGAHPARPGPWLAWTLTALVALAATWLPRSRASRLAALVVIVEIAWLAAAWLLFRQSRIILPIVPAAGLAAWVLILRVVARKAERVIAF